MELIMVPMNAYRNFFILLTVFFGVLFPGCKNHSRIYPRTEWQEALPGKVGISEAGLDQAIDYLRMNSGRDGVEELVIIRNGYLIFRGDSVRKVHGVWSMTKSFTSTVLGLLIQDGKCSLNTLAGEYVPDLKNHYGTVTLKHFATMTSGYRAVGDEPRGDYKHGPSLTPFLPDPVPLFPPGEKFAYWDSAMNEFANVLSQVAEGPLDMIFKGRIAEKTGIRPEEWYWGDLGRYQGIRINSGAGNHTRMEISALAVARLGLLFLRRGNWDGNQLISEDWVEQATRVQVPASLPLAGFIGQGPGVYGYNWWVNGIGPEGRRKWPDAPAGTYSASRYNNNDLFVIPEWDMVIVRLGMDQSDFLITDAVYNQFISLIGRSFDPE